MENTKKEQDVQKEIWKESVSYMLPMYPDGVMLIKEDNLAETPVAIVPFPMGGKKNHIPGFKRQLKNSHLIATAPELLDCLKKLVHTFDYKKQCIYNFAKKEIDEAIAVIEKAERDIEKECEF